MLRVKRAQKGWTKNQASQATSSSYIKWELDQSDSWKRYIPKIAEAFDFSQEELEVVYRFRDEAKPKTKNVEFGNYIATERAKLGMSVQELANLVGCSAVTLRRWEAGVNIPTPFFASRMPFEMPIDNQSGQIPHLDIGKYLAHLRKAKMLTQEQLASELGVSEATVYKWENGKQSISKSKLNKLLSVLGANSIASDLSHELRLSSKGMAYAIAYGNDIESYPLGERIRIRRKQKGLTQQEFANIMGVATITVHKWEAAQSAPSEKYVEKLEAFLQS